MKHKQSGVFTNHNCTLLQRKYMSTTGLLGCLNYRARSLMQSTEDANVPEVWMMKAAESRVAKLCVMAA
jgi:hypothetical protein